jgi:hypothetical protein
MGLRVSAMVIGIVLSLGGIAGSADFLRGDCNLDGELDISDPLRSLTGQFMGGVEFGCPDACDGNDDGELDISDPIHGLTFLFLGGLNPPPPYPEPGPDPTGDDLGCGPAEADDNPFGVSSSAPSAGAPATWMPQMAQAGVKWARLFPEWNGIQPTRSTWNWTRVDSLLDAASAQGIEVSGLFFYNVSWLNSDTHTFPMADLAAWSAYVSALVSHAKGRVRYWEVWNEPQGFAAGGTPDDYAQVAVRAFDAARAADPDARIGLSVAANDVNYLERTIAAGAAGHFDFVAVHPYEITEALEEGWEPVFMGIVRTIRKMLAASDPPRASAPVWFTELGRWSSGSAADDARQARDLMKAYTMAIAQGAARVSWYEARDGQGGFGLIRSDGSLRPACSALKSLTAHLGPSPRYQGWVQMEAGRDYGFVFQGPATSAMPLWASAGATENVTFGADVRVLDPPTGSIAPLKAGSALALSGAPVLILDVPSDLVTRARENKDRPFPWGGDYTGATTVSVTMGNPNADAGLHQFRPDRSSTPVQVDGTWARDASLRSSQDFAVDPNFLSFTPTKIAITAITRRNAANDAAGFNLRYESRTGWKTTGVWYSVPGNDRWYTKTWTIDDDEFVGIWGFHFRLDSDSTSHSKYLIQKVTMARVAGP